MKEIALTAIGIIAVVLILLIPLAMLAFASLWLWSWHPALAVLFGLLIVCSDGEFMICRVMSKLTKIPPVPIDGRDS